MHFAWIHQFNSDKILTGCSIPPSHKTEGLRDWVLPKAAMHHQSQQLKNESHEVHLKMLTTSSQNLSPYPTMQHLSGDH